MFNLERAIEEWKRQMKAAGFKSGDVLYELESHLREDFERQVREGADEETAFAMAVQRIGEASSLRMEFVRSQLPEKMARRKFMWWFYFVSAAAATLIDAWTVVSLELSSFERIVGTGVVVLLALYLWRLPFSALFRGGVPRARALGILKVGSVLVHSWILWALLTALEVIRFEIGILPNLVMWSFCAAYVLTIVACMVNQRGKDGPVGWEPPSSGLPWPIVPRRPRPPGTEIPVPPATAFGAGAQEGLESAREEAVGLGHDFVGTEHLLLGMLTKGGASHLLDHWKLTREAVRAEILRLIGNLPISETTTVPPLTPRARRALNLAGTEAKAESQSTISSEHVVLGLLLEGHGAGALALRNLGVRLKGVRRQIRRGGREA